MLLAVQYYRPPFPTSDAWEEDLDRIAGTGMDAVQLWLTWGWIEPAPGEFRFDDYDGIIAAARQRGLKVVLSTIAECQPFWMHRVVPDSRMVNHLGLPVTSGTRRENNVGITPGGCWDNPEVLERLGGFLTACVEHFRDEPALVSWDVWNETRWSVHADAHVCYCEHTLTRFRSWLHERHGGLDGLNQAWQRRYSDWDDVMPGRAPGRMYTESMEFQRFLTWRAGAHMQFRATRVRELDHAHPVGAHCVGPSAYSPGVHHEQAVSRGNDWDHVASLDSYGLSMYPDYFIDDAADFGGRLAAARSACAHRDLWVCELEAAPTGTGFTVGRPVSGADVRRWIYASIAHGATAAVLWQWYDERIGPEASAFGLSGDDGDAAERMDAVAAVAAELAANRDIVDGYRPDPGQTAVVFDEGNYYLDWAEHGAQAEIAAGGVSGYIRALEWTGVPYQVLHGRHLSAEQLRGLRLVILPAAFIVPPSAARALTDWVRDGGTLLVEADLDSWTEQGFYRYPHERPLPGSLGIAPHGRRPIDSDMIEILGAHSIAAARWVEPVGAIGGDPSLGHTGEVGAGRVIAVGTLAGLAYHQARGRDFEAFVADVARAADALGAGPALDDSHGLLIRGGRTTDGTLLFLINHGSEPGRATLRAPGTARPVVADGHATMSRTGSAITVDVPPGEVCVLRLAG